MSQKLRVAAILGLRTDQTLEYALWLTNTLNDISHEGWVSGFDMESIDIGLSEIMMGDKND